MKTINVVLHLSTRGTRFIETKRPKLPITLIKKLCLFTSAVDVWSHSPIAARRGQWSRIPSPCSIRLPVWWPVLQKIIYEMKPIQWWYNNYLPCTSINIILPSLPICLSIFGGLVSVSGSTNKVHSWIKFKNISNPSKDLNQFFVDNVFQTHIKQTNQRT